MLKGYMVRERLGTPGLYLLVHHAYCANVTKTILLRAEDSLVCDCCLVLM